MRISGTLTLAGCLAALGGCGLPAPERGELVSAEAPLVARADFDVRLRHTDLVRVHVLFPSDADGRLRANGGKLPALVLIQGGRVAAERYEWLGEALARRGYVTALPEHALDLAFFSEDNGLAARALLVDPPQGSLLEGKVDAERIAVGGHSLGGVVAAKLALRGGFQALLLLASYPDSGDADALASLHRPSMSLAGGADCSATVADVSVGARLLPEPKVLAVVLGATHYQFTDSQKEDEDHGCLPEIPLEVAHARIGAAVGLFLDGALGPGVTNARAIDALDGVDVVEVAPP